MHMQMSAILAKAFNFFNFRTPIFICGLGPALIVVKCLRLPPYRVALHGWVLFVSTSFLHRIQGPPKCWDLLLRQRAWSRRSFPFGKHTLKISLLLLKYMIFSSKFSVLCWPVTFTGAYAIMWPNSMALEGPCTLSLERTKPIFTIPAASSFNAASAGKLIFADIWCGWSYRSRSRSTNVRNAAYDCQRGSTSDW